MGEIPILASAIQKLNSPNEYLSDELIEAFIGVTSKSNTYFFNYHHATKIIIEGEVPKFVNVI